LNNSSKHIDKIIKDKFEQFTPAPPTHIWKNVSAGIIAPVIPFYKRKAVIASAAIIALLLLSVISVNSSYFGFGNNKAVQLTNSTPINISSSKQNISTKKPVANTKNQDAELVISAELPPTSNNLQTKITPPSNNHTVESTTVSVGTPNITDANSKIDASVKQIKLSSINPIGYKSTDLNYPVTPYFIIPINRVANNTNVLQNTNEATTNITKGRWSMGYYLSPELAISSYDSVEILNSYTLSVETDYFINKNWFFRSGIGISYVRDQGFAKINYLTNEYMGSYDDVYNISFDTVLGVVTPVYHTKTVEVWDSINHIIVSNVTNKYIYLQIPALLGYKHKNANSPISWYVFGGPVFNLKVGSWIDNPQPEEKDADIIDLQNKLPIRNNNYFQFWVGAGIQYKINTNLSIAIEPIYKYYFKSIYKNPYTATSSSGVALRVGLVYTIK